MSVITPKIRSYLAGTFAGGSSEAVVLISGFCNLWLLTQILDKSDFGLYSFVFAGFAVVGNIVTLGVDRLLLFRLGETNPNSKQLHGGDYVSTGLILIAITSVVVGFAMITIAHFLVDDFWHSSMLLWVVVSVVCLPCYSIATTYEAWLTANHRVPTARFMYAVPSLIRLVSLVGVFLLAGHRTGVAYAVVVSAALPLLIWLSVAPLNALQKPRLLDRGEIAYSLSLMGSTLVRVANQRLDILMVGLLLSNSLTAEYAVVSRIANLVSTPRRLLNPVFQPRLRFALAGAQVESLYREYAQYRLFEMAGALFVLAFLVLAGTSILSLFGDYASALILLVLLSLTHLVNTMFGPNMQYLNLAGYASSGLMTSFVLLFFGALTNFVLIPFLGITGAALATLVSALGVGVMISILIYRWDRFHTTDVAGVTVVVITVAFLLVSFALDVPVFLAGLMVASLSALLLFLRRKFWLAVFK